MMILPLVLIVILPKMMSDPETRREMESVTMPKYEMPEMSEVRKLNKRRNLHCYVHV